MYSVKTYIPNKNKVVQHDSINLIIILVEKDATHCLMVKSELLKVARCRAFLRRRIELHVTCEVTKPVIHIPLLRAQRWTCKLGKRY